ncbi:hypothetical protein M404DRAFT_1000480 [Pisolithus tinctorius Marx 270]|uniref:Uncharacterized protein n=1 Tax=Pisolithus tinctorius Marx 270 TaxID=870435 RepID=A0A0C3J6E9_PISTI|nr:hypothetical protein M404DRAFT_1000480 [Pisolithus tinctorius Marx 270]
MHISFKFIMMNSQRLRVPLLKSGFPLPLITDLLPLSLQSLRPLKDVITWHLVAVTF